MLQSGCSWFFRWFWIPPIPFTSRWPPFQVRQWQLVLPSLSCSIAYFSSLARSKYLFIFLLFFYFGLAVFWSRVFANGPGDLSSIPGRVIPKTQKIVLDTSLLNTQRYEVRIKGKVEQSREGVAPSPTPWCSSYRKGSFRVTLDYGRQL